jgi:Ricin-type beta-trefoil lectin domain-like
MSNFIISSANSGLVLDVPGFSKQPLTIIQQYDANYGINQQWQLRRILDIPEAGYLIISANSGLVLDVPDFSVNRGTKIQQFGENGGANQQWTLRAGADITSIGEDGPYRITSVSSGLVLDEPGFSQAPLTQIQQWTPNGGANQYWALSNDFVTQSSNSPSISVQAIAPNEEGGQLTVSGSGFIPGQVVSVVYMGIPGISAPVLVNEGGRADGSGNVEVTDTITFSDVAGDNDYDPVIIGFEDSAGNLLATTTVQAALWVP